MSVLRPIPFPQLVRRAFREIREKQAIFDLPARRFATGTGGRDLGVALGRQQASSPIGPAAGPHTQLAQNLVLSWLAGGRVLELKTVQVLDELELPRPCIDMRNVGLNCEWSQELRLDESLEEYVKGALLVRMLAESGLTGVDPAFQKTIYDASVGYDLAGLTHPRVQAFLKGLGDVRPIADRLRSELPADLRPFADVTLDPVLSDTITVSTFHGCPPAEIESIATHLFEELGFDVVVKLNPTLLGARELRGLLHDTLGYTEFRVPDAAFAHDPTYDQACGMIHRLQARAKAAGRRLGVKLTNTLIVENTRAFFPAEVKDSYLSGAPLHVLASTLVARLRETFGGTFPLSFSAGIDAENVAEAVALGLAPVTVCTDWLKTGGYSRGAKYYETLGARMGAVGVASREGWILEAFGHAPRAGEAAGINPLLLSKALLALRSGGDPRAIVGDVAFQTWVADAAVRNARTYAARVVDEPRYRQDRHAKAPRKVGSTLTTFDCLTCDKCVPVCPNDANFTIGLKKQEIARLTATHTAAGWDVARAGSIAVEQKHQLANYADSCNDCGNCDVFCPEDGGPFLAKPRFHGSLEALRRDPHGRGLFVTREAGGWLAHARLDAGPEIRVTARGQHLTCSGPGFDVRFDAQDPAATLVGEATVPVDLTAALIVHALADAVLAPHEVNPVSCS